MKEQVLKLLAESDGFVSGQKICETLGISRTAVWKDIEQLREDGYVIEAVRNKGYLLKEESDVLSVFEIGRYMKTDRIGREVRFFEETDSTNLEIKRAAENGAGEGLLVIAEYQSKGRGRLGRTWKNPKGWSLAMSLLLKPEFSPDRASMLTLVAAMAVTDAIIEVTGVRVQIKWPNDIVTQNRKLVGILTEMGLEESRISYVVVGIGVNCNNESFPEDLADKAISLKMVNGENVNRSRLAAAICYHFEKYYRQFCKHQDLSAIVEDYNRMLVNLGHDVVLMETDGPRVVKSLGINRTGALVVENADGEIEEITSGEVSVRGVYGYT